MIYYYYLLLFIIIIIIIIKNIRYIQEYHYNYIYKQ